MYAAFVASNLPANVATLFDNTIVRLVVVLLILALATCDPASAILLTIGFVLSIQTANKLHISKLANAAATGSAAREAFMDAIAAKADSATHDASKAVGGAVSAAGHAAHDVVAAVGGGGHSGGGGGHSGGGSSGHHQQHPQVQHNAQPSASAFTSPQQLAAMQSNAVSDNQETEVRTWQQELGPQGLQQPSGFSFRDADAPAPFSAGSSCSVANTPPSHH